jgi:hypothetical protein
LDWAGLTILQTRLEPTRKRGPTKVKNEGTKLEKGANTKLRKLSLNLFAQKMAKRG